MADAMTHSASLNLRCLSCGHAWAEFYLLPMPAMKFAELLEYIHCQKCRAGLKQLALGIGGEAAHG